MSRTTRPFGPYASADELAKGRRKMLLALALAVGAVVLGVVAQRTVGDGRLVTLYLAGGGVWFLSALAEAVRWSSTRGLGAAD